MGCGNCKKNKNMPVDSIINEDKSNEKQALLQKNVEKADKKDQ
jgi:hypothetical protein